jgi:hypothetical protein
MEVAQQLQSKRTILMSQSVNTATGFRLMDAKDTNTKESIFSITNKGDFFTNGSIKTLTSKSQMFSKGPLISSAQTILIPFKIQAKEEMFFPIVNHSYLQILSDPSIKKNKT